MTKESGEYLRRIEPIHQHSEGYCGPASLLVALRALGIEADQDTIDKTVYNIKDGMSWEEMENAVRLYGCSAFREKETSYDHLLDAHYETGLPIIVAWMSDRNGEEDGAHFSVVKHMNLMSITLADPEFEDYITYSSVEFMKKWRDEETERAYMVIFPPVGSSSLIFGE